MRRAAVLCVAIACSRSGLDDVRDATGEAPPIVDAAVETNARDATDEQAATTSCHEGTFVVVQDEGTAARLDGADDIAVDDSHVYWHSCGGLYRAPKTGGVPTLLKGYQSQCETPNPAAFVMDDTYVYYYPHDGVHRFHKDGSGDQLIASLPNTVASDSGRVAFDEHGDLLVWLLDYGKEIDHVPLDGGAVSKVQSCGPPTQVGSRSGTLVRAYDLFTLAPGAWRDDLDARTSKQISTTSVWNVAMTGTTALLAAGDLLSMPLDGGAPTVLVGLNAAYGIAVDDPIVYFTDSAGPVGKVSLDGGAWSLIANEQASGAIAVDDSCVYWVNPHYDGSENGALLAAPK